MLIRCLMDGYILQLSIYFLLYMSCRNCGGLNKIKESACYEQQADSNKLFFYFAEALLVSL